MARKILDQELTSLNTQIVQLATLVDTALGQALQAMQTNDLALCQQVVAADAMIDRLRAAIEQHTFRLLTLQQPLGGADLRFLSAVFSIVSDLERSGDGAKGIAQMLIRIAALGEGDFGEVQQGQSAAPVKQPGACAEQITEATLVQGLLDLGQEVRRVLKGTIKAFTDRDKEVARRIYEEDDIVDVRYHMVRHDLMTMLSGLHAIAALEQDHLVMQRVTYYLWMAHKLERVGDHCGNVCERLVYILEGVTTPLGAEPQ